MLGVMTHWQLSVSFAIALRRERRLRRGGDRAGSERQVPQVVRVRASAITRCNVNLM